MLRIHDYGVAALETGEEVSIRGGDGGIVELIALTVAAAGAGFAWGYKYLGPIFNKYI